MSKSLDPSTYPEAFWVLVEEVEVGNAITAEFKGTGADKKAQDTRLSFYGFRRALKKNGDDKFVRCVGIEVGFQKDTGKGAKLVFSSKSEPEKWTEINAAVAHVKRGERVKDERVEEAVKDYIKGQGLTPKPADDELPDRAEETAKGLFE